MVEFCLQSLLIGDEALHVAPARCGALSAAPGGAHFWVHISSELPLLVVELHLLLELHLLPLLVLELPLLVVELHLLPLLVLELCMLPLLVVELYMLSLFLLLCPMRRPCCLLLLQVGLMCIEVYNTIIVQTTLCRVLIMN